MVEQREPELPRGIALAWGVAAAPQRGPKREMSVERIVDVAVEIADADGLSAVSMAAVAAKLGYTPMSLYRYVTAKDDLVLLMQEQATGLPSEASREGTWRERLESLYAEQVSSYLAHPGRWRCRSVACR
ncbi:TetR/AcrR family transcriptional regulator [Microbacterium sp. NIBRBAC000506063]|uniref:TetR/AcrR family transcriptional regulator n=1 Tax=Microbacterium sp. NIBRBAC000506063 TaxID=2734618 RepID=UPI001CB6FF3D|nr:TetR family transcriptional regulator [Microbacterium sp. NIBRBAC000506063]